MRSTKLTSKMLATVAAFAMATSACGNKNASFGLLTDETRFTQNSEPTNGKIDVLWVIDNSGSMDSSQQRLAAELQQFIQAFDAKGFDYRIAVVTSDAYRDMFGAPAVRAKFKDGTDQTSHTGVFMVTPSTPDRLPTFMTNVLQGTAGSGDERPFQSIERAMMSPENAGFGFPRADAFLSVILVSDEDDFSHDGSAYIDGQYTNPALHTTDRYISYLDGLTGATAANRSSRYNVNSIHIQDQACLDTLNAEYPGRRIGLRYTELVDKVNGIKGSLCDNFGTTLSNISNKIIELATQFYLDRTPQPETLAVTINGVQVPHIYETDPQPWNGFIYHADTNSLTFHGSYVPPSGATIAVRFDPTGLK
ncbi:MAG: hypothetical protein AAB250_16260 [Bdellovibrionota bacterium]